MLAVLDSDAAGQPLPLQYDRRYNVYHTPDSWMRIEGNHSGFWPAGN